MPADVCDFETPCGPSEIKTGSFITAIEFCPFKTSSHLLAYSLIDKLIVLSVDFDDGNNMGTQIVDNKTRFIRIIVKNYEELVTFDHKDVCCIAWSPATQMKYLPRLAKLAAGNQNGSISVLSTDLCDEKKIMVLEGHKKAVNAVAFHPYDERRLASTGDDHTVRIWDVKSGSALAVVPLLRTGMSLCWNVHSDHIDSAKLMAAEMGGRVRIYEVAGEHDDDLVLHPIHILESESGSPLTAADWCPLNPLKVGAVAGNELILWDISSQDGLPSEVRQAHSGGCTAFRWSRHHEDVFLTQGRPKHGLKVHHCGYRELLLYETADVGTGASWNAALPVCVVAGNRKLTFHDLSSTVNT